MGNLMFTYTPTSLRQTLVRVGALAALFAAIHFFAYWLRFDGQSAAAQWHTFWSLLGWVIVVKLVVFLWLGVCQSWTIYVTFHDLMVLLRAATISSTLLALGDYIVFSDFSIPRSVFLMDWAISIVVIGGVQSIGRFVSERDLPMFLANGKTPVLIVGVNNSGEALLRAIRRDRNLPYRVVGFISEQETSNSVNIGGVPILGHLAQTCEIAEKLQIREVLITAGELSGRHVRQLMEDARRHRVAVKVLPSYEQLLRGDVDLRPRTVAIEDVLRRDPVQLNLAELHRWIDDQVLLVTGSAGSIGSEICRQLVQFSPKKIILVDRSETGQFFLERELRQLAPQANIDVAMADITDERRMNHLFATYRPDIVFHAAAYKHVPLMEANVGEAVKNITLATRVVVDLSHRYEVKSFVQISTDKAVNPTSVMGACKRVAELYVQALAEHSTCRFVTVRFGNVLDSAGSVVPIFRDQIASGGPVTVTHPEMKRFFMTIPEASQLVIQAGAMGRGGEIFVLHMGEPVRIVDLATDMIRLSGLQVGHDIEIEFVGVRPGEKLFEELHVDGEQHLPTSHPKIMVTQSHTQELHAVTKSIERLATLAERSPDEVRHELKRILPTYRCDTTDSVPVPLRLVA